MSVEKERFSSSLLLPPWVKKEHVARYSFAAEWCQDKVVLDCACGSGEGSAIFAEKAVQVHAFDIAEETIKEAEARKSLPNLFFSVGRATDLPVESGSVDVYVSLETIEHVYLDDEYLREAFRVLRDGGTFICSTPNRKVTNPGKSLTEKPANPYHVREYDADQFLAILEKYFESTTLYGQNPATPLVVRMLNFVGRFLPGHFTTRIHQLKKLLLHPFRGPNFYIVRGKDDGQIFEYLTVVCTKGHAPR
jgi:ubiquinone/menaquinone biosynthesis C-methylase UbiE